MALLAVVGLDRPFEASFGALGAISELFPALLADFFLLER